MKHILIFSPGETAALDHAVKYLTDRKIQTIDHPSPDVTHLLLGAPAFDGSGRLRFGGDLEPLLSMLPDGITVIGGNLNHPGLHGYTLWDLLKDERYLAKNAEITAHCALSLAAQLLPVTLAGCPVLVIGWGRIGKILAKLLGCIGADVTVAARRPESLAMAEALGFRAVPLNRLPQSVSGCRVILNTVPAPVLSLEQMARCRNDCLKIDLASVSGMAGSDVIRARGLPGKEAPESSVILIAQTVLGYLEEREEQK